MRITGITVPVSSSLQQLLQDDTICLDEVLDVVNMAKNIQAIKKKHPYPIKYTEKSGWYTFVDDVTAPTGKKLIRKVSEEKLMDALSKWYLDNSHKKITLEELYSLWINWKQTPSNTENIWRLNKAWEAYYKNEPLTQHLLKKQVCNISTLDLRRWAEELLKKHYPADKKKFSRMFTIMNQMLEYASDEDIAIIPDNTWQRARKKINKSLIVAKPIPDDATQVFTDEERILLKKMVEDDLIRYEKTPTAAGLEILFLFETGLRIAEVTGLKWTDIVDNRLYIRRQANNQGVKEKTKSMAGYRDIPLTREARRILDEVRKYNEKHNLHAEWIFQSNNPKYDYRLSYNAADRKLRKLCDRLDTISKSPHKIRKTCISTLLDNPDINSRTVQRFAGHSDITMTMKFYNFERKSKEEQAEAIDRALALD